MEVCVFLELAHAFAKLGDHRLMLVELTLHLTQVQRALLYQRVVLCRRDLIAQLLLVGVHRREEGLRAERGEREPRLGVLEGGRVEGGEGLYTDRLPALGDLLLERADGRFMRWFDVEEALAALGQGRLALLQGGDVCAQSFLCARTRSRKSVAASTSSASSLTSVSSTMNRYR